MGLLTGLAVLAAGCGDSTGKVESQVRDYLGDAGTITQQHVRDVECVHRDGNEYKCTGRVDGADYPEGVSYDVIADGDDVDVTQTSGPSDGF